MESRFNYEPITELNNTQTQEIKLPWHSPTVNLLSTEVRGGGAGPNDGAGSATHS